MAAQTLAQNSTMRRRPSPRVRRPERLARIAEQVEASPRTVPRIASVFRGVDGKLHHARCGREVELVGVRGGIELDFHCLGCFEHVTLTQGSLSHVPIGQGSVS